MVKIITPELIDLKIDANSKEEAIESLANKINNAGRLYDYDGYYNSVIEREELTSTGIGFGIAIPHGKCPHVKETTVAFGRLNNQLDWESIDGVDVNLIFLLAVPEKSKGDHHLRIIANLSRKLIHEEFRDILHNANEEKEILELLNESLQSVVD